MLKLGWLSNFRYSSEQRGRHSDVIIDLILMFLVTEYWSYPPSNSVQNLSRLTLKTKELQSVG